MGKFAQIENNFVTNVIVMNAAQLEEMSTALGCELVDAEPYNLSVGDYRKDGVTWTRNIDGVQTELTEKPTYAELEAALAYLMEGGDSE